MLEETRGQLRDLADGDSYAAFKSAALACGLSVEEIEAIWQVAADPDRVVLDVRESGAELRGKGKAWLTSTAVERVDR